MVVTNDIKAGIKVFTPILAHFLRWLVLDVPILILSNY